MEIEEYVGAKKQGRKTQQSQTGKTSISGLLKQNDPKGSQTPQQNKIHRGRAGFTMQGQPVPVSWTFSHRPLAGSGCVSGKRLQSSHQTMQWSGPGKLCCKTHRTEHNTLWGETVSPHSETEPSEHWATVVAAPNSEQQNKDSPCLANVRYHPGDSENAEGQTACRHAAGGKEAVPAQGT